MAKDDPRKDVFTVIERPGAKKSFWVRIGTAFVNRDDSLTVKLDAFPVNGTLNIRDPLPPRGDERSGDYDHDQRGQRDTSRRDDRGGSRR